MKRKKESQGGIMQEAIEKASQLIGLLQKENTELKRKVENYEKQLDRVSRMSQQLKIINQQLRQEYGQLESKQDQAAKKLDSALQSFTKSEENLRRKINTNKELHEKIADLNIKLRQKTKQVQDEKRKNISLQNENKYLMKKIQEWEEKQNLGLEKNNLKALEYQKQIKQITRIKEAFGRRCQQLKTDNLILTEKAAEYKQKLIEAQSLHSRLANVIPEHFPIKVAQKLDTTGSNFTAYFQEISQRILRQSLGVTPDKTLEGRIEQINSFLSYRLRHIQKICQNMNDKLQIKEWVKVENLKDLSHLSLRIHSYLSQLMGTSV